MRTAALCIGALVVSSTFGSAQIEASETDGRKSFGKTQFDEVIHVLRSRHLKPGLKRPRVWAAAANGVLSATGARIEVVDAAWLGQNAKDRVRFSGEFTTLRCGDDDLGGVALHSIPAAATWREQEKKLALESDETSGEPLVDVLLGWKAKFDRSAFDCTVAHAQTLFGKDSATERGRAAREKMWRAAATYLLRTIDPHSRLTTPRAWATVNEAVSRVVDLGLTFKWRRGLAVVHEILAHASDNARLVHVGDVLDRVDGKIVRGILQSTLIGMLQRPAGSSIGLTFRRPGVAAPIDVQLKYVDTREKDVELLPVQGLPGAIRVRLRKFAAASGRQVREELEFLPLDHLPTGFLLDLRGNRGGIIPEAVTLVEVFRRGGLIGRVRTRDAAVAIQLSRRHRRIFRAPMVMLVDGRCASACEFVAGSLQDGGRALIVGVRTFGKATLQEYMSLKTSDSRLMITVAMFSTPDGRPIQARGVTPDIKLGQNRKKTAKARGEAAMSFHLKPLDRQVKRRPHPLLNEVRSCWTTANATLGKVGDGRLRSAVLALRCLMVAHSRARGLPVAD